MKNLIIRFFSFGFLCFVLICSCRMRDNQSDVKQRDLNQQEAMDDFRDLVTKIRTLYGPLSFKEQRFGYTFDQVVKESEAAVQAAKTDAELFGIFAKLLTKFKDGHVSIAFNSNSDHKPVSYKIPIMLTPIEQKAIVSSIGDALKESDGSYGGITVGDELIEIDGKKPYDLLPTLMAYRSLGNDVSDEHLIANVLDRKFYMTDLTPTAPEARLVFKAADGKTYEKRLLWRMKDEFGSTENKFVGGQPSRDWYIAHEALSIDKMGSVNPFFLTTQSQDKFKFVSVKPDENALKKFGLDPSKDKIPEIYAALYRYNGKSILLVRQPGYYTDDPLSEDQIGKWIQTQISTYEAILDQYQELADVLVIDQTHNPGGFLSYAMNFFAIFIQEEKAGFVQAMHADRQWIDSYKAEAILADKTLQNELSRQLLYTAKVVEDAYNRGEAMTAPIPMDGHYTLKPGQFSWKKPMLVLADELAGSCGDIFPMLIKRNNVSKLFGQRTMGLGGNVETTQPGLIRSNAELHLTRGLYTTYRSDGRYTKDDFVENNGIQPDIVYTHTVEDFRAGYIGFIDQFSKSALEQIK